MKKIVAWMLALGMMLSMAACGGETQVESSAPGPESQAPVQTQEATQQPAPPVSQEESSVLEASSVEETMEGPAPLELPLADYDVTLSVWWSYPPWLTNYIDAAEKPTFVEMTKRTGVNLDVVGVSLISASEQFSLMLASNDLTDIIADFGGMYSGTFDQAVEQDTIIDLREYIDTVCPNYYELIHSDDTIYKTVVTNEGNIPMFASINDDNAFIRGGYWYNTDMLSRLKRDVPVTLDDWYDTLTAARDELGADSAFWMDSTGSPVDLLGAYDVTRDFYQVDNQVKFGYLEDGMKDYLTMMSKWYAEGLVYKDFYTQSSGSDKPDTTDIVQEEQCILWRNSSNAYSYFTVPQRAISAPVKEKGQQLHFSEMPDKVNTLSCWVISSKCEEPEIAAKFLDYFYSQDGRLLTNYGIEGVSYEMVDGKPQFTDLVTNNPDGISFNQTLAIYAFFNTAGTYVDNIRMDSTYDQAQIDSRGIWADHNDTAYNYPSGAAMTVPESEAYYAKYNEIDTYIDETVLQFILGDKPLTEYDAFRETLISMGIEDCLAIRQTALDRYNSK